MDVHIVVTDDYPDGITMTDHHLRSTDLTIVCHVRAPLLLDPVDSKIETLKRCADEDCIDSLIMRSWADEVTLSSDTPDQEVVETFQRFQHWADARGVSVTPPFRVRTATSIADDEPRQVLVTPILCLACYDHDQLVGVYPHTDGETTRTATDAIAALSIDELPPGIEPEGVALEGVGTSGDEERSDDQRATHQRLDAAVTCPECAGSLCNVQGLAACAECGWSDGQVDALDTPQAKLVYLSLLDGPVALEALEAALDLNKLALFGILRTLNERGLIERVGNGEYAVVRESDSTDVRRAEVVRAE